jgi:Asp-tRNA(Asn)/Glu-tRNA(Gln) amidotransferase A subunit family amidase
MPAVTIPGLTDENRMPIGVQIVGIPHSDDRLLAIARWLESILPPPPVPPV